MRKLVFLTLCLAFAFWIMVPAMTAAVQNVEPTAQVLLPATTDVTSPARLVSVAAADDALVKLPALSLAADMITCSVSATSEVHWIHSARSAPTTYAAPTSVATIADRSMKAIEAENFPNPFNQSDQVRVQTDPVTVTAETFNAAGGRPTARSGVCLTPSQVVRTAAAGR